MFANFTDDVFKCIFLTKIYHYHDVIMSAIASQITSLTTIYLIVYSRADQRKHQSSTSLAFVRGIHRRPVNSPHKGPVTRKIVPFDDVIMSNPNLVWSYIGRCGSYRCPRRRSVLVGVPYVVYRASHDQHSSPQPHSAPSTNIPLNNFPTLSGSCTQCHYVRSVVEKRWSWPHTLVSD